MEKQQRVGDLKNYANKLLPEAKGRYAQKLADIDGIDPYEIPKHPWSTNPDDYPDVTYINMVNYFVFGKSPYTTDDFKAYKSMKAYKLFVSGWVRDVQSYRPDQCQNAVVSAKVLHSQRLNEKPLTPWVIASQDGTILSAHCTCMAGVGETCTHVAALCFAIDTFSRTREKATCTGVKAYWKVPQGVKGVTPKPAAEIDFSSAKAKKDKLDKAIEDETAAAAPALSTLKQLPVVDIPNANELMTDLFSQLKLTNTEHNVLKVLPAYCGDYKANQNVTTEIPASLRTLRQQQFVGKPLAELQEQCRSMQIQISESECRLLEEKTRKQADCGTWFLARAGRITASNSYATCHTDPQKPAQSLIKKNCYPDKMKFTSTATKWGIENERQAKKQYVSLATGKHTNLRIRDSGIHISPDFSFMGASPDAIVECDCHGIGCLEIKCPHSHRTNTIADAAQDKAFCLQYVDGKLSLKESHPYYYQCQAQLFLTKSAYCDFVIWTCMDVFVTRLFPNQLFWDDCVIKAQHLFKLVILPELVGNWIEHQSMVSALSPKKLTPNNNKRSLSVSPRKKHAVAIESDKDSVDEADCLYCICQQPEHGRMIACDDENCAFQWFHYGCVGLKRRPKGTWYCSRCARTSDSNPYKQKKLK